MKGMLENDDTIIPSKKKKMPPIYQPMFQRRGGDSPKGGLGDFFQIANQMFGSDLGQQFFGMSGGTSGGQQRVSRTRMTSI